MWVEFFPLVLLFFFVRASVVSVRAHALALARLPSLRLSSAQFQMGVNALMRIGKEVERSIVLADEQRKYQAVRVRLSA